MGRNYQDYQHVEETLPNGLKLLHLNMPNAHGTALAASVRGGPVCENAQNTGISHLLEHLHLSIISSYPTRLEMLAALDNLPGDVNAETAPDELIFKFDVPPDYLNEAAALLVEILQHRSFPTDIIETEKSLLTTEIASMDGYRSAPMEKLFGKHSYGQPYGGNLLSVHRLTVEQIEEFDQRMFVPDAMTVSVVGPLENGRLDEVRRRLSSLRPCSEQRLCFPKSPDLKLPRTEFVHNRSRTFYTTIAFVVTSPSSSEGRVASQIALMGLTRMSSPLYEKLRYGSGIAYLFSTDRTNLPDMSLFWIYGMTLGRNRNRFLEDVFQELRATRESVTPRPWFEPARRDYLYYVERALDYPAAIASRLLRESHRIESGTVLSVPEELRIVRELTWEKAREVYAAILQPANLFVCTQAIPRWFDKSRVKRLVSDLL